MFSYKGCYQLLILIFGKISVVTSRNQSIIFKQKSYIYTSMSDTQKIKGTYLLGSIALGALTAYGLHLRKLKSQASPTSLDLDRQPSNQSAQSIRIQKPVFNKLQAKDLTNELVKELKNLEDITCEIERVPNLVYDLSLQQVPLIQNPMLGNSSYRSVYGGEGFLPENAFVNHDCFILQHAAFGPNDHISRTKRWLRAGPRKHLFWAPQQVKAAVVVLGGLCPGLNVIIRELTMCLHFNYKVTSLIGAKFGYNGIYNDQWVPLEPGVVKTIHHSGGCYLGTARSCFDPDKIIAEISKKGINQLYLVGGTGTLRSAEVLYNLIRERKLPISLVLIPKSIENEIPIFDKSFGFETAIEAAQYPLRTGYAESHTRRNAVAIVRFIGRNTGFLAMYACLAFRSANICLVPEFPFDVYGPHGLLEYVYQRLKLKGTCLLVVAEGATNALRDAEVKIKGKDASGNDKLGDIGLFLKEAITKYVQERGMNSEVKYIDPQYMVRSGKANSLDSKLCSQLAQNAVHAAMAGFTGFACGHVSNKTCLVPLSELNSGNYANKITSTNISWQRLLASTGQPSFQNDQAIDI